MAAITIVASALLWGSLLYLLPGRTGRYLWLIVPALPLSALANYAVKAPLATNLAQWAGVEPSFSLQSPWWFIVFVALLAPVTEEAIKLSPLLLGRARRMMRAQPGGALWTGMALGIGFGIGEAAYIAHGIANSALYTGLPWYMFTGYLGERMAVCFVHGAITAVAVAGVSRGLLRGVAGYLAAVGLHLLVNLGPILSVLGMLPPWGASLVFGGAFVLLAIIFEHLRRSGAPDAGETVLIRRREGEQ
jgi:hypothetical protein